MAENLEILWQESGNADIDAGSQNLRATALLLAALGSTIVFSLKDKSGFFNLFGSIGYIMLASLLFGLGVVCLFCAVGVYV